MNKKGFTLVDLITTIAILAIIFLIATPIVMNMIEKSRKGAAERSIANIEHAAELYFYDVKIDNGFKGTTFVCTDKKCSNNETTLTINGTVPDSGTITISKDGTVVLEDIVINDYLCNKDGETYKCEKTQ